MAPRQPAMGNEEGYIILSSGYNYEQALDSLEGFDRIWLIYWFDRNANWKPKVQTPRGGKKKGVFATRSPHRPNPLGLSCVQLLDIKGRKLFVGKNDLLEGTPILDIKPYLSYADAYPESRQGWLETLETKLPYNVSWSALSQSQAQFIEKNLPCFISSIELRLKDNPHPFPSHRIKKIGNQRYELAFKTWRIIYRIDEQDVAIEKILSGYNQETLSGKIDSLWEDLPFHQEYLSIFENNSERGK